MENKKDFLVDCVITAGELDENGYRFVDNNLKVVEIAKHNVPYSEFEIWINSIECMNRVRELETIGKERFGRDYYMKYQVCKFCTPSHED